MLSILKSNILTQLTVPLLFLGNGRLEAAVQRLTNLCSVLNDMEPICVLNHVFVLREVIYSFFFNHKIT